MADGVAAPAALPNHLQLPCRDGVPVRDAIEAPQSALLTESLSPLLSQLFPEDRYFIGADVGIYWRLVEERLRGAKSPDWYLVTEVPNLLDGEFRRSYVLWQEQRLPLILLEFAPSDSTEEHDRTPEEGKYWVYENRIRPSYLRHLLDRSGGVGNVSIHRQEVQTPQAEQAKSLSNRTAVG